MTALRILFPLVLICLLGSCDPAPAPADTTTPAPADAPPRRIFTDLDPATTGIDFANTLTENDTLNYFTYTYMYMGGGVAAGDFDGDGRTDLFFTGNMVPNRLYLNRGGLRFTDATGAAGLAGGADRWYTGVTTVDINDDGRLDLYLSVAGQSGDKRNQLFVNQGGAAGAVPTFKEMAEDYGLADPGNSVNATFFDYDRDGDLDVYVVNYPITPVEATTYQYFQLTKAVTPEQSDHLYRNDGNGHFTDVTKEAGVMGYVLSLSATAADLNQDGWTDLFVSSDFAIPDKLFLNNQDGTFREVVDQTTGHTAFYGMGADVGDVNNDGHPDIFQVDMDAATNRRSKANMASMDLELFTDLERAQFHTQYMQNALQLWVGQDPNGNPRYAEISRLAGVSSTDWSWGPLLADLDNDGFQDLFITNGTRREINNKDYFKKLAGEKRHPDSLLKKSLAIPSEPIDNFAFRNRGDLTFERVNDAWGITHAGFSNGVVYADLDDDGDLEVVTNNIDAPATVWNNDAADATNYLGLRFRGPAGNRLGLGTTVRLTTGAGTQYRELTLSRGFQSAVAPRLHFGLGATTEVDELTVTWPDGHRQQLRDVAANQLLEVDYADAAPPAATPTGPVAAAPFRTIAPPLQYTHKENPYDDFDRERLLPHRTSAFGPGLSTGDLNGDGLDDLYVGAASGYPGGMFFQRPDGTFEQQKTRILIEDRGYEDLGSLIFDADGDGDNDLYLVSGGNEFPPGSPRLRDRLYVNDGRGNFSRDPAALPPLAVSGGRVTPVDYDRDGDLDLVVGGRLVPGNYPRPADSHLLENRSTPGQPRFVDVTAERAPALLKAGLVTTVVATDLDGDGYDDLALAGEWMPLRILHNDGGAGFSEEVHAELAESTGWWFSLAAADFDGDGDRDLLAGNLGENYKYQAKGEESFDIFFNDFDGNRTGDIVLGYYNEGEQYPVRGRQCSSEQMPGIAKKFKTYDEFSTAKITDVYDADKLEGGIHYRVRSFASAYFENDNGTFRRRRLPTVAQIAPINQILVRDVNADGHPDAIVAGNLHQSEVETPRADAGHGLLLLGDGAGNFTPVGSATSGLFLPGDVKDLATMTIRGREVIVAAKNDDFLQFIEVAPTPTK